MSFSAKAIILIALISLAACSSKNSDSNQGATPGAGPGGPAPQSALDGLSVEEVLRKKYDRVELNCEIRIQNGRKLDPSAEPNNRMSWNLLTEYASSRSLKVIDSITNMTVSILINVNDVKIVEKQLKDPVSGAMYDVKYSPELAIEVYDSGRVEFESQPKVMWSGSAKENVIQERMSNVLISHAFGNAKLGDGTRYFENVTCALNTLVKSSFADQFNKLN